MSGVISLGIGSGGITPFILTGLGGVVVVGEEGEVAVWDASPYAVAVSDGTIYAAVIGDMSIYAVAVGDRETT